MGPGRMPKHGNPATSCSKTMRVDDIARKARRITGPSTDVFMATDNRRFVEHLENVVGRHEPP